MPSNNKLVSLAGRSIRGFSGSRPKPGHKESDASTASSLKQYPQQLMPYDGCTAAAYVAYAWSEQAFIYPITPATPMGEVMANWAGQGKKNMFGSTVQVTQMQSEAGAAGACHGVVDVGSLATTFTSSQGLLLMVPNMYIIAGALNPCVFHVAARSVTKHALCIFGDHTDVMATRQTGWAQLSGHNVQEAMDMALVSHVATLKSSVPFMNFFDGFRTSHEINKIHITPYEAMEQLVPWEELQQFRQNGLNPNRPHARQVGQFSDTFFQNSEAANKYYDAVPNIVQETMDQVGVITGRKYQTMEYVGHPEPEQVIVVMGSGSSTVNQIIQHEQNEKYGMIKIHLYRPWDAKKFLATLPKSVKRLAVLDRTKEQSALGEPLFLDVCATLQTVGNNIKVVGGRYGLGSKEFTPGMARAVFENLKKDRPIENFSVGIDDDITHRSLPLIGGEPDVNPATQRQCLFWGMGSDGTVSANKNAIKMIADNTDMYVQAYFAYDSKKAGGCTISHMRFGPDPIDAPYAIMSADYIAVSQRTWPHKFPNAMLETLKPGGTVVFNSASKTAEEFAEEMPQPILNQIGTTKAKIYTIDANKVARENGLGRHTNNVLAAIFFKLSEVIPYEQAEKLLKQSMRKSYASKGDELVQRNLRGLDSAIENLVKIEYPADKWAALKKQELIDPTRPKFATEIMDPLNALEGNRLPVSAFNAHGHFPSGTTKYEKRGIALTVPVVDMDKCTQCNKCSMICPHAAIRPFLISQLEVDQAPKAFDMRVAKGGNEVAGLMYRIQVAPEDCTGCEACSWACPDSALTMTPLDDVLEVEKPNWTFAANLPNRGYLVDKTTAKGSQFQQPMLEFSGACEGCGETPYAKLVTQLFGERMVIANASGCSSVWAGTMAFNPLATNQYGQGPAWGRSLFEDAAEYGLGMARATHSRRSNLGTKLEEFLLDDTVVATGSLQLKDSISEWLLKKNDPEVCKELAVKIPLLIETEGFAKLPIGKEVLSMKDHLPKLSVWVWGGDGWAYDIGFGGLDHVLASQTDLNVLVMDTEGYSNTGGQISKATNLGAVQKFAPTGYKRAKKDLGAIAMAYEDVYVASIAIGANYGQSVKALVEAEAFPGPSLVLCYSPCIEHKILFPRGLSRLSEEMQKAVESGYWSLYRFNPALKAAGVAAFSLDSKRLAMKMDQFTKLENRFQMLHRTHPDIAGKLQGELQQWAEDRMDKLKRFEEQYTPRGAGSQTGETLSIIYGSDTGTTTELTKRFADLCRSRNFQVSVYELDEVSPDQLASMNNVVVLCSTAGEGDFPANAHTFWENISSAEVKPGLLSNTKLSVFGLGDTGYRHFNAAAKKIEARLSELGAKSVQSIGLGNDKDADKYETAFESWLPEFWKVTNAPESTDELEIPKPSFALTPVVSEGPYYQVQPPRTKLLTLEKNDRLTAPDYDREIRHLVFDLKDQDVSYLQGDALTMYPTNDPSKVSEFLNWYGVENPETQQLTVTALKPIDPRRQASFRHAMTAQQMFTEVIDILGRPNKNFYKQLRKYATSDADKKALDSVLKNDQAYSALASEAVNYADVLRQFPSAKPPVEHLMSLIPCIKPRLYSIASSQRFVNDKLELAIVILDWKTASGKKRRGLATDYVHRTATDKDSQGLQAVYPSSASHTTGDHVKVACSIAPGSFHFPKDLSTPYVMTGLGTGLAPFRSFIQERAFFKRKFKSEGKADECGPMWLFYGCRFKAKDYIFGNELEAFKNEGVLTDLLPAFSRDQKEKIYVQHRMLQNKQRLYEDLVEKKGFFYLCGQAGQLEVDVRNALIESFKEGGKMSQEEAKERFEEVDQDGRYCLELY